MYQNLCFFHVCNSAILSYFMCMLYLYILCFHVIFTNCIYLIYKNYRVLGKFKSETGSLASREFVGLLVVLVVFYTVFCIVFYIVILHCILIVTNLALWLQDLNKLGPTTKTAKRIGSSKQRHLILLIAPGL